MRRLAFCLLMTFCVGLTAAQERPPATLAKQNGEQWAKLLTPPPADSYFGASIPESPISPVLPKSNRTRACDSGWPRQLRARRGKYPRN